MSRLRILLTYQRIIAILLIALVGAMTVALQVLKMIDVLASVTEIWIWIAAILLGIASNLLTKGITVGQKGQQLPSGESIGSSSAIPSIEEAKEGSDISETEPKLAYLKLGFQSSVKRDLLEIEPQLNFKDPKHIDFKSWNEIGTDLKKQYIDNETVYGLVENIAKLVNEWNNDLDRASLLMLRPDSNIYLYIQSCGKYYAKLREIGFLN
jgi:hypothetical protein